MDSGKKALKIFCLLCLALLTSCQEEEFLKVCYNEIQTGCVTLDQSRTSPNKIVNFSLPFHSMSESEGAFSIAVTLSEPTLADIVVPFKVSGDLNCTGSKDCRIEGLNVVYDDIKKEGLITIPKGKLSKTIIISLIGDNILENNEKLNIELLEPENAEVGSNNKFTLEVRDDDLPAEANFVSTTYTFDESAGVISAYINLSKPTEKPVFVNADLTGTAVEGVDYTRGGLVIVSPTQFRIDFTLIDENVYEVDETIIVELKDPINLTLGTDKVTTITVTNNDTKPYIYYSNAFATADEDDEEHIMKISLSSLADMPVDIELEYTGTAVESVDYNPTLTGIVTIPANTLEMEIPIELVNDGMSELDETVIVEMKNPVNCQLSPSKIYTLTIKDDETLPVVGFRHKVQTVNELEGQVEVEVFLDKPSGSDLNINYTVTGTAVNPTHHDLADGVVTINSGSMGELITFNLSDDGNHGNNKTVIIDLAPAAGTTAGLLQQHTVEILDPKFITLPIDQTTYASLPTNDILAIEFDEQSSMIVLGSAYGIADSGNTGLTFNTFGSKVGVRNLKINDIAVDQALGDSTYAATPTGLLVSNNKRAGFKLYDATDGIASSNIKKVIARDGKIAIATAAGLSVSKDNGDTWFNYTTGNGLPSNNITGFYYHDLTDSLIIMTDAGITRTSTWIPPFSTVVDNTYLDSNIVIDITFDSGSGNFLVLTTNGLNIGNLLTPTTFTKLIKGVDFSAQGVLKKVLIKDDKLVLIKSDNIEISNSLTGGPFTKVDSYNYLSGGFNYIEDFDNITDAVVDGGGYLYITSSSDGIYKTDSLFEDAGGNSVIKTSKSLISPVINDIEINGSDIIIAGTDYGLAYSSNTTYDDFVVNTNVGDNKVESVHIDGLNYVALTDFGVYSGVSLSSLLTVLNQPFDDIAAPYASGTYVYKDGLNLLINNGGGGLILSTDGGASGSEELGGINILGSQVNDVFYNGTIYAISTDLGVTTFSGLNLGADKIADIDQLNSGDLATDYTRKYLELDNLTTLAAKYIATDDGVYYSFDLYDGDGFAHNCAVKGGVFNWCYSSFGLTSSNILDMDVIEVSGSHVIAVATPQELGVSLNLGYSYTSYKRDHGLPSNQVNVVRIMSDGRVVVGTDYGLAISRDDFL